MGRYYDISLSAPTLAGTGPTRQWTSLVNGVNDPGALNVEFDFLEYVYAIPMGNSTITIEGIALSDLLQAQQFVGLQIAVRAGMSAGLPLADPTQAGLILQGQIFQSFGNWVGTEMTLDFVVVPSIYTFDQPGNLVVNWKKGAALSDALATTLGIAYPGYARTINIRSYVLSHDVVAYYHTLAQLAKWVKSITATDSQPGVDIAMLSSKTILVTDGSVQSNATQIKFTDFIGQPTWIDQNTMQFTTVMRADIQVGGFVLMPQGLQNVPGIVQTAAASLPSSLKYKTSFQGAFIIQSVRHIGNFRDAAGASWSTTFQCAPQVTA